MKPVSNTSFPLFLRAPQPAAKSATGSDPAPAFVLRPQPAPGQAATPCPPQAPKRLA
ncbi:hypothetical protein [Rivihabitans pingtungensis]|uniref:Uncharacterized protein n=1 Tax=Rivihabitans pingtungensis TaxID=1054498 RepID=A0A318KT78_9NEIS|nr:hypothetical protein [Rivihabitans pingtungensis]PXX79832.1 hypothetical protein DFR34_10530 [Rivihabitans pingtungensis]